MITKVLHKKLAPGYTENVQIAPMDFDVDKGIHGSHIIFWGNSSQEVDELAKKLPKIINYYFEMHQGKD